MKVDKDRLRVTAKQIAGYGSVHGYYQTQIELLGKQFDVAGISKAEGRDGK